MAASTFLFLGNLATAATPDCAASLFVGPSDDGGGFVLALNAPCAPYTPVILGNGPVQIGEETDAFGHMTLKLPALDGVTEVTATLSGIDLSADLSPVLRQQRPVSGVFWPDGMALGTLGAISAVSGLDSIPIRAGFPGEGPIFDWIEAEGPVWLDLPLSPKTCGQTTDIAILREGAIVRLTLALPACNASGGYLRIPLSP